MRKGLNITMICFIILQSFTNEKEQSLNPIYLFLSKKFLCGLNPAKIIHKTFCVLRLFCFMFSEASKIRFTLNSLYPVLSLICTHANLIKKKNKYIFFLQLRIYNFCRGLLRLFKEKEPKKILGWTLSFDVNTLARVNVCIPTLHLAFDCVIIY